MADVRLAERARELFLGLLDLHEEDREPALESRCGGDAELQVQVRTLLAAHRAARDFLNHPVALETRAGHVEPRESASASPTDRSEPDDLREEAGDPLIGCRIGRYEVLRALGAGGMGAVYEARQEHPRRVVALKLIRPAASREAQRRFAREAHVLGQLRHPGIAQIYEAGIAPVESPWAPEHTTSGVRQRTSPPIPFFAMELIRGRPIDRYVREAGLSVSDRLRLFAGLCDAVEHAHSQGVIHRDLKPANVLVDEFGQPKVLDFGVARFAGSAAQATLQTEPGQLVGTLGYMSPEQIGSASGQLDARSDVYALGVLLFELIAGCLPYDLSQRSVPEAARIIREEEPSRLSSFDSRYRGDLETIVAKALEKDPARRYGSVREFAADVRRLLLDQPIVARPPSALYQLSKFARRNRALVAGTAGILFALAVGVVATTALAVRELQHRQMAESRAAEFQQLAYVASIAAAAAAYDDGDLQRAQQSLQAAPAPLRNWEWRHLAWAARPIVAALQNPAPVKALACSADGTVVAAIGVDDSITIWDITLPASPAPALQGDSVGRIRLRLHSPATLHPSGHRISRDKKLLLLTEEVAGPAVWDLETGTRLWGGAARRGLGDISPDAALVAVPAEADGLLHLRDARTGELKAALQGERAGAPAYLAAFDASGRRVRADSIIFDVERGAQTADLGQPYYMALSPDWSYLARCWPDFKIEALPDRQTLASATWSESWEPAATGWLPDGRALLISAEFGLTRVFDRSLAPVATLRLPRNAQRVAEAQWIVSWTDGGVIELRQTFASGMYRLAHPPRFVGCAAAVAPDGQRLAIGDWGYVRMHDVVRGELLWCVGRERAMHSAIGFSPDGRQIAVAHAGRQLRVMDADTGDDLGLTSIEFTPRALVWRPGATGRAGAEILVGGSGGALRLCDAQRLTDVPRAIGKHDCPVNALAFSPDGHFLASGSGDGLILPDIGAHSTGGNDNTIRIWDADTWQCVHSISCGGPVVSLAYSPDGALLAAGLLSGEVALHSVESGVGLKRWTAGGAARALTFHPDGSRLVAVAGSALHLWDTSGDDPVAVIPVPSDGYFTAGFTPDGRSLVASGRVLAILRLDTGPLDTDPREWFHLDWAGQRVARLGRPTNADIERSLDDDDQLPVPVQAAVRRVIELTGDHVGYLISDGILLIRERETRPVAALQNAIQRLARARELAPASSPVAFLHALALYYAGRTREALAGARDALDLQALDAAPPTLGPMALVALCEARLGNSAAADAARARLQLVGVDAASLEERELLQALECVVAAEPPRGAVVE